jgi:hypothetical protein
VDTGIVAFSFYSFNKREEKRREEKQKRREEKKKMKASLILPCSISIRWPFILR